jgi:hypothetical protein
MAAPQGLLSGGMPMGKLTLGVLTVFPPTGYAGLNLIGVGAHVAGMAKAASYALGLAVIAATRFLYPPFAAKMVEYILMFAPPWYVLDVLQLTLDPEFDSRGFRAPFDVTEFGLTGKGVEGKWLLTGSLLSLILAVLVATGFGVIVKFFPDFASSAVGKSTQYGTLGATALLAVGGIGASFMGGSTAAPHVPQTGGGLPPLSSFAKKMMKSDTNHDSVTFLGILGMVVVGGLTLAFLRSTNA